MEREKEGKIRFGKVVICRALERKEAVMGYGGTGDTRFELIKDFKGTIRACLAS